MSSYKQTPKNVSDRRERQHSPWDALHWQLRNFKCLSSCNVNTLTSPLHRAALQKLIAAASNSYRGLQVQRSFRDGFRLKHDQTLSLLKLYIELSARTDFIEFSHSESLKTYTILVQMAKSPYRTTKFHTALPNNLLPGVNFSNAAGDSPPHTPTV